MDMTKCKGCNKTINVNTVFCPKCGEFRSKNRSYFSKFISLFFILSILYYLGVFTPQTLKDKIKESIIFIENNYTKSGLGNYYTMSFIIKNNSKYKIENIKLKCNHYADDGVKIGQNYKRVDSIVKSQTKKVFNNIAMGLNHSKTVNVKCKIIDFMIN